MVVPVSLRPDRRGQTLERRRGVLQYVPYEESREYRRKQEKRAAQKAEAEHYRQQAMEQNRRRSLSWLFATSEPETPTSEMFRWDEWEKHWR